MKRVVLVLVLLVSVFGFAALYRGRARSQGAPGAAGPGGAGSAGAERIVPVTVMAAARTDVPIVLEGLGTVTPLLSVTVKSQVDGRLDRVAFKEGQAVKRGDLLAEVDPRPFTIQLHQGEAALARDEAQLANAKLNLERYETLRAQNLIAQQQLDDQRALTRQAEAAVMADRATLESARLMLDYARIKSPIDGVTGVRMVDPGNLVRAGDATGIVVVTQLDPIAVLFTLPQDALTQVTSEMAKRELEIEALSRDGGRVLGRGKLTLVDNQVNAQTSTIRLKAVVPNPERVLWPNAFVKARLHVTTRKDALVVAATAVQRGPKGPFVYVVVDEKAVVRPVTVEAQEGDVVIIAQGIAPGDVVVVDGQSGLRPDAKVAARPRGDAKTASSGVGP